MTTEAEQNQILHKLLTCSGRAVQASSSYEWVPPPPPPPFSPVGRCLPATGWRMAVWYKRQCLPGFCTMCWKVPVNPTFSPSLHAEKCVTIPLVRGPCAEKCWLTPTPRVYTDAEKCVTLPLEDLVIKSASPPLTPSPPPPKFTCWKIVLLFP